MDTHTHPYTNINNGRKAASQVTVKYDRWVCGVSIGTPPSEQPLPTLTFDLFEHTLSSPHLLQCLNTGVRNPVSTHSRQSANSAWIVRVRPGSERASTHAHDNIVNSLSNVVTSAFHQYFNSLGKTLCIQWHVHTQTHASAKSEHITKHNICKLGASGSSSVNELIFVAFTTWQTVWQ